MYHDPMHLLKRVGQRIKEQGRHPKRFKESQDKVLKRFLTT